MRISILLILVVALTGCATLFNDKTPSVGMRSNLDAAEVYVNGSYVGEAPIEVDLSIRKDHTILFRKEGYRDKTYRVTRSAGLGWIVLDILGGLVPLIVDAATGDWFMLDTDEVNVVLQPSD